MSGKPIIFISSTIYDFRDLRSALKFWLEELGYEVMLSDFNDFKKPLDENSYTACLKAIERASYFILLIGARTGGFFDAEKKISITRMEYRTAYDLVKAGKMKLITFVRGDLWNVKEDRKALTKLLKDDYARQRELTDADVEAITNHSSTLVNDAEAAFNFLQEVGRVDEMKQGAAHRETLPVANWIHPFSSFQDIVETLSTVLNTKRSLATIALTTNLKREFLSNLTQLTSKTKDGEIILNTFWADLPRTHFNDDLEGTTTMPARYVKWLVIYSIRGTFERQLSTQFVDQSLMSGAFLDYDFSVDSYKIGVIHKGLFQLKENIIRLKELSAGHFNERVNTFI